MGTYQAVEEERDKKIVISGYSSSAAKTTFVQSFHTVSIAKATTLPTEKRADNGTG